MQFPIPDQTAILLSREFYSALGDNTPVDAAVSEARKIIRAEVGADSFDWGIPVLFMRAPDGVLLHVTPPPRPKGEAMFSRQTWAAIIAGIVLLLGLLGGIAFGVLRQAGIIPTPEPTLVAAPAAENEYLVLVADFYSKGGQKYDVINRLAPDIQAALEGNQIPSSRVVAVPDAPRTRQEVLRLAKRYNASIVVWGWYDDVGFEANVEVIASPFLASLGGEARPTELPSKNLGEVDAAPETLRTYLRKELSSQVNFLVLYTVGHAQYSNGWDTLRKTDRYEDAKVQLKSALSLFQSAQRQIADLPEQDHSGLTSEVFYTSIGTSYLLLAYLSAPEGSLELSIENFQRALAIKADHAEALYLLGVAFVLQGKQEDAKPVFEHAIAADRSNDRWIAFRANIYLGYLYNDEKDLPKAEWYWHQAYELKPDDVTILLNLGYLEILLDKYDEAIQLTEKALKLSDDEKLTDEMPLTCNLGLIYLASSKSDQAAKAYDQVLAFAPKMTPDDAAFYLGQCLTDLNDLSTRKPELASVAKPFIEKLGAALKNYEPAP
jgi:tetratricopeptide (TPR) repeat protein